MSSKPQEARMEQYFVYGADGRFRGGSDSMAAAVVNARVIARAEGFCDVEQIIVSATEASQRRTRFFADGRMERLWVDKEKPHAQCGATQGMES